MVPTTQALNAMDLPLPLLRNPFRGREKPWWFVDGTSMRPGYNLTPQKLFSAYLQAEMGAPMLQCDLFEDLLENDGHLRGQYTSRLSSVAFRPWMIQPGDKRDVSVAAAVKLTEALGRCNVIEMLWHIMSALGFGYSGTNVAWKLDESDMTIVPERFLLAPHRRFLVDRMGMGDLTFRTEKDQWPGISLNPGPWMVAIRPDHRLAVRAGVFRTTSWWALFKRLSIRDWIVFAEKFGIPLVIGEYAERASPESRAALLQAVTDIGSDGQAVLSEMTKIVIQSGATRSGDVASLHPAVASRCDAEISKVVTGATLNVETGGPGSFALGKVHETRAYDLVFADALWVASVFASGVSIPFLDYNPKYAGAAPPRFVARVQPQMSPEIMINVFAKAQAMGLPIDAEQMYEQFGLRRPDDGDELKPLYEATPEGPTTPAGS